MEDLQNQIQIVEIAGWLLRRTPTAKLFDKIHVTQKLINNPHWIREKGAFNNKLNNRKQSNAKRNSKILTNASAKPKLQKNSTIILSAVEIH